MIFSTGFKRLFYLTLITLMALSGLLFTNGPVSAQDSGSSAPVILTIEPSLDRKPISPHIYGVNIANWCSWYYMHMLEQRLRDARVEVVRLGATNMERYNFKNNRMYNVISKENNYVSLSWESFVMWTHDSLDTEPFLMVPVFGNVASDSDVNQGVDPATGEGYSHFQSQEEVMEWVKSAGEKVRFWGVGNEPWIAWKRSDYPLLYSDAAHGDQVLNSHISYDYYFNRFATVAKSIKAVNPKAGILGPTSANWFLYWFNDYSPLCPVTDPGGDALIGDYGWQVMADPEFEFDKSIFPDRGQDPEIAGWETDSQKILPQYLQRMRAHEVDNKERIANYMDVHRYIRCITEYDAIQEPRGLFQKDFSSWDMETKFSGKKTNLLNRLNNAIAAYYPGTLLSFSEYEYFYWDGYPSIPQVTAVATMDFLGFFARGGVSLACNWYVGEPNQSGLDLTHARRDSAMQAMFDEAGNPNPKYWSFYMMSNFFRGTSVKAESSNWDRFSVHACEDENKDYVVFAVNKGSYDKTTGDYIPNQPPLNAAMDFPLSDSLHLTRILRYGLDDPHVVEMDITGLEMNSQGRLAFDFHPLAVYAFIFSGRVADNQVDVTDNYGKEGFAIKYQPVFVSPDSLHFAPYDNGETTNGNGFTHSIKITNGTQGTVPWSVTKGDASWLTIEGNSSGAAAVTDSIHLTVNWTRLLPGTYEADVFVNTGLEGSNMVRVVMDVVPGEENGEKRIADFETGSLAHTLNIIPPYSVGWWDGHGAPNDRNMPYLYDFTVDKTGTNRLGGAYCMNIRFDRNNGDTENGKLYQSFGTYGHSTIVNSEEDSSTSATSVKYSATGNWTGYDAFEFDIKTETIASTHTDILMILSDLSGNQGKPAINLAAYTDLMAVQDGPWQTVTIPLNGIFFDWRYPEGQNGSETAMDFSNISQIEFVPWSGDLTKKGEIWLDNLRLTRADGLQNHFPVAMVEKSKIEILPDAAVVLNGSQSYDPDENGEIADYRWIRTGAGGQDVNMPDGHLSDQSIQKPVFSASEEGIYLYDLIVKDRDGLESRNIAQVMVAVSKNLVPDETTVSMGGGSGSPGCFCSTIVLGSDLRYEGAWLLLCSIMAIFAIVVTVLNEH